MGDQPITALRGNSIEALARLVPIALSYSHIDGTIYEGMCSVLNGTDDFWAMTDDGDSRFTT
jgi:hypothetical protein